MKFNRKTRNAIMGVLFGLAALLYILTCAGVAYAGVLRGEAAVNVLDRAPEETEALQNSANLFQYGGLGIGGLGFILTILAILVGFTSWFAREERGGGRRQPKKRKTEVREL